MLATVRLARSRPTPATEPGSSNCANNVASRKAARQVDHIGVKATLSQAQTGCGPVSFIGTIDNTIQLVPTGNNPRKTPDNQGSLFSWTVPLCIEETS